MITSKDNSQFKALKRLIQQPKRSDRLMAVEGIHACQLLLEQQHSHQLQIERVWVGSSALANTEIQVLLQSVAEQNIKVIELPASLFREVSSLEQGVSIIFEVERPQCKELPEIPFSGNVVLLDGIQDPGNMGSIVRSCAAAGVNEVWLNAHCVNPYAPKVLRAGVGAHFGLNIREGMDLITAIQWLRERHVTVCATSSYAQQNIYEFDLNRPIAWLMGNEGAGVSEAILVQADIALTIPMTVGESLNVAAATAVCLFEMQRQRQSK